MRFVVLISFLLSISALAGNTNPDDKEIAKLKKKNLVYHWVGLYCPGFDHVYEQYGFRVQCVGCISLGQDRRNNRRVCRKVNNVYGHGWLEKNISYLQ